MHVLTLVDHLSTTGGAERLALDIATRLSPSRFRSTLCASRFIKDQAPTDVQLQALERLREAGVTFLPLS